MGTTSKKRGENSTVDVVSVRWGEHDKKRDADYADLTIKEKDSGKVVANTRVVLLAD